MKASLLFALFSLLLAGKAFSETIEHIGTNALRDKLAVQKVLLANKSFREKVQVALMTKTTYSYVSEVRVRYDEVTTHPDLPSECQTTLVAYSEKGDQLAKDISRKEAYCGR